MMIVAIPHTTSRHSISTTTGTAIIVALVVASFDRVNVGVVDNSVEVIAGYLVAIVL